MTFSNYRLTTYDDGVTDARRYYKYHHDNYSKLHTELDWTHQYERLARYNGIVKPFFRYAYRYGTVNHPEYRLERMSEWSDRQSWGSREFGASATNRMEDFLSGRNKQLLFHRKRRKG